MDTRKPKHAERIVADRSRRRLLGAGLLALLVAPLRRLRRPTPRPKDGRLWIGHRWPEEDE